MDWDRLLETEMEPAYRAAEGLMKRVDDGALDWKPSSGENWMTTGQLLRHMTEACGALFRGFVTGEWGFPTDDAPTDQPEGTMFPPAESLPTIGSVAAALEALAADRALARRMLEEAAGRLDEPTPPPWDPENPLPLGQQLLGMVNHLNTHKAQLFYYLKLQGQPLNTLHLYGMA